MIAQLEVFDVNKKLPTLKSHENFVIILGLEKGEKAMSEMCFDGDCFRYDYDSEPTEVSLWCDLPNLVTLEFDDISVREAVMFDYEQKNL